jgi:hypothetical protein
MCLEEKANRFFDLGATNTCINSNFRHLALATLKYNCAGVECNRISKIMLKYALTFD